MQKEILISLLDQIHGATFATLDTETVEKNIHKVKKGERVILFRTKGGSGFEAMVNRRLAEAGLPTNFKVGPLPWGTRVNDLPLIENKGKYYLQCIRLNKPKTEYFLPGGIVCENPEAFGIRKREHRPDLPGNKQVFVSAYNIDNITRIALLGEELKDSAIADKPKRAILKLSYGKDEK